MRPTMDKSPASASRQRVQAASLSTARLDLEPLRVDDADEMAEVLGDPRLHTFIGGAPASAAELRSRYERQVVGRSADGTQDWLNWVLRRRDTGQAVGTVQATVTMSDDVMSAEVAWVVGAAAQGQRFASEAAQAMVAWLRRQGVRRVVAHVHPEHAASIGVARAVGLSPTDTIEDGEVRWEGC